MRFNFGWGQAGKSTKLTERSEVRAFADFGLATKSICLCCIKMELSVLCKVTNFSSPVDFRIFLFILCIVAKGYKIISRWFCKMKMYVVGIQKVDFVPKDSDTPIRGVKVHVVKDCNKSQPFVIGRVVDTIFISSSNPLSEFDFKVDKYYDFIYDFDGHRGYLIDIKLSA